VPRGDALLLAKRTYVAGARQARQVLGRVGIGEGPPPSRDRRLAHWTYSLTRVHDSIELAKLDVPWWTYGAIDTVEAWMAHRSRPPRVFEYGSGASTVWLARRAGEVHSVEHHRDFADHLRPVLSGVGHVTLQVVEPRPARKPPAVASGKEGYQGLDFAEYVATIHAVGGEFDLIVIDGRARASCLPAARAHLVADGLIVFDNSWRSRYRAAISNSGLDEWAIRGLVPTLPYPDQTSLLSDNPGLRTKRTKAGDTRG
jgi:Methyltransferase domain